MIDLVIFVEKSTRQINLTQKIIGVSGENNQTNLVFKFSDEFVDGTAWLEASVNGTKKLIPLTKKEDSYEVAIKNSLLIGELLMMNIRITQGTNIDSPVVFKSNQFYLRVADTVNATEDEPDEYKTWIEIADTKFNEIDKAIDLINDTVNETIEMRDSGAFKGDQGPVGPAGQDGLDGKDALINGVNTVQIVAGENIDIQQDEEGNLTINGTAQYDDTEIRQEISNIDIEIEGLTENINNIASEVSDLSENKADRTEIPDISEFIKKSVNDLENYYLKTETYTQEEVNQLIGAIKTINIEIVDVLPEIGDTNKIYFTPSEKTEEKNIYDEYIYVSNKWELIGSTKIDLSNYYTKDEINTLLFDYITSNDLEEILKDYATKEYVDAKKIPTKTSELENDSDYVEKNYVDDELDKIDDRIDEIQLTKFPNAIIHGNPIINQGQVSGFTRENYLSLPAVFNLHDRGFEFNFAFRTGNDVATAQNILGSRFCMALLIENSKLKLRVSQNGSSWDLVDIEGNIDIQPNTTYYVQIYFDKLTYKLRYSTDGEEYIDIASKVASVSPNPAQIYLGVGNNFFNPFGGIINLNKCNLKVNNSIIWNGLDDAGLQTRMATDMENIDEAGIAFINSLIDATLGDIERVLATLSTPTTISEASEILESVVDIEEE